MSQRLEITLIEGRQFKTMADKFIKFSTLSNTISSKSASVEGNGLIKWNESTWKLNGDSSLQIEAFDIIEGSPNPVAFFVYSLDELFKNRTQDVWITLYDVDNGNSKGQIRLILSLQTTVERILERPTLNNNQASEISNISLQSEPARSLTSKSAGNKPELLGKLEIQLINGKEIRKVGGSLFTKDSFYVKMSIVNSLNPKAVKSKENESGGVNPIWNDLLILKVYKGDIHLTVEIWQKDASVGTGVVLLDKYLEPEKAQSLWVDVERKHQFSGSVQMILTFKPLARQSSTADPPVTSDIEQGPVTETISLVPDSNMKHGGVPFTSALVGKTLPEIPTNSVPVKANSVKAELVPERKSSIPVLPLSPSFQQPYKPYSDSPSLQTPYSPYPNNSNSPTLSSNNAPILSSNSAPTQPQEYVPYPNQNYSPYGSLSRQTSHNPPIAYDQTALHKSHSQPLMAQPYVVNQQNGSYQPYPPPVLNSHYIAPTSNQSYPSTHWSHPGSTNQAAYPAPSVPPYPLPGQPSFQMYAPPSHPPPDHFLPAYQPLATEAEQYATSQASDHQQGQHPQNLNNPNFPNNQYFWHQ